MTSPNVPKLSVRSIADLIAAVPYLLGFHPTQSIVVVALRGKRLVFAARVDLPTADATPDTRQATANHLAAVVAKQNTETATVIGYGPAERVTPIADATAAALRRTGLEVMDVLRVTDGRYWSYTCDNPECCPPQGTPFDPDSSHIAAAAIFAGQVALPDREALQRQVAEADGAERAAMQRATDRAEERLAALLRDAGPTDPLGGRALQEAGEAAVRQAMERHRDGGRLSDDEVAWLSLLLLHIPVRDHAWELMESVDWQVALWTDLVRRVQPELVAPPASLLAFAAWRLGQGALASVALERARQAVPDYSLALLLEEVLQNGIPPSMLDAGPEVGLAGPGSRRPRRSRRQPRRRSRRRPPHATRSAPL
ncbi:MAG TPA: DUF4192 domain-containing protein [Micromonosporaceae bacterium]|nr:DUF4192 domain-containing protein [Micromonosporaceae bacterium]